MATVLAAPAMAETYACQYIDANGFYFEGGRWKPTLFNVNDPFFLKIEDQKIVAQSIKIIGANGTCTDIGERHACMNTTGTSLYFNDATQNGGFSHLFGAGEDDNDSDTVDVELFVCETI